MAAYLTPETLRQIIAPDGDVQSTAAALADGPLQVAIDGAQTEVDGRLAVRYQVPFAEPVPKLVASITADIAELRAVATMRKGRDLAQYDPAVLRAKEARTLLEQIVRGHANLIDYDGPQAGKEPPATRDAGFGEPINPNPGQMFTAEEFGLGQRSYGGWDGW